MQCGGANRPGPALESIGFSPLFQYGSLRSCRRIFNSQRVIPAFLVPSSPPKKIKTTLISVEPFLVALAFGVIDFNAKVPWTFWVIFGQQSSARTALWPSRPECLICCSRSFFWSQFRGIRDIPFDIRSHRNLCILQGTAAGKHTGRIPKAGGAAMLWAGNVECRKQKTCVEPKQPGYCVEPSRPWARYASFKKDTNSLVSCVPSKAMEYVFASISLVPVSSHLRLRT